MKQLFFAAITLLFTTTVALAQRVSETSGDLNVLKG